MPDEVNKAIERGWLLDDDWHFSGKSAIESCVEESGGKLIVDEGKLPQLVSPEPQNVVLTDFGLKGPYVAHIKSLPLAITISPDEGEILPKTMLRLGFFLFRLRFRGNLSCFKTCCIWNIQEKDPHRICEECGPRIPSDIFPEMDIRIRIMAKVLRRPNPEANDLFHRHWIETLIPLQVRIPEGSRSFFTRLVQDHYLQPQQPRRIWLQEQVSNIISAETRIKERYRPQRSNFLSVPFLIACRRWNSWTPNIPQVPTEPYGLYHLKGGGGYLVSDGFKTLAVDPGYGFLDMLFQHGVSALDIDAVIITHDHPDHSAELQNIMDLCHAYRKETYATKVRILLNPSAFYLHERMLRYHHSIMVGGEPELILPGDKINIGNIEVATAGMLHEEIYDKIAGKGRTQGPQEEKNPNLLRSINGTIIAKLKKQFPGNTPPFQKSQALGLRITLKVSETEKYIVVITGDTGIPDNTREIENIQKFYQEAHIACVHLGSLEREWVGAPSKRASDIKYKENNHLGLNGVVKFLNLAFPQTAIITEFGEELDAGDVRLAITELIKELVYNDITIVPSDVPLFLAMKNGRVYFKCMGETEQCQRFVPVKLINYAHDKARGTIRYCFSAGCDSKLQHEDLQVQLK